MRKEILAIATVIAILVCGCRDNHLIGDKIFRLKVDRDFQERKDLAKNRDNELFSVFRNKLKLKQEEALKFLFAYMPLSDLADYNGDFFLINAELALKTQEDRPWGRSIPEDVFLHYVLPVRVNNENLDSFRIVYYDELAKVVKGLDTRSAALEINHWCHEKVSYQPADIRTSGPLSTILSARGRCGEESTFAVAALRTAGLPARQVYTPRWAHSDDNHAWVEVWIDGIWYYMGACEPEPVLDRGWFTEPSRRAMLIHTKSFGAPSGEGNIITSERNYAVINNLSKYAITKTIYVKVIDKDKTAIKDAQVEYQLYNNAEFYPLAVVPSDKNGISSFETGLGDLFIWAHKGNDFNYSKISVNEIDTLTIVLDKKPESAGSHDYDLGVPVTRAPFEGPTSDMIRVNGERLNNENKIRDEYIRTWMKPSDAVMLAISTGTDSTTVKDIISRSMGNFRAVTSFLKSASAEDKKTAVKILTLVADKDLRDTPERILNDHLCNSVRFEKAHNLSDENLYNDHVLNPRIANELIVPWRKYLYESLDTNLREEAVFNPRLLVDYVNKRISIDDSDNYYRTPISPTGVDQLRIADKLSRDIYFIAICRTLGIPARLEPGSNRTQYFHDKAWNDVYFANEKASSSEKGFLKLLSNESQPVPEYYIHFSIARFENGRYNTLEYDYNRRISDFKNELELVPGYYMLVTGNRISDSKILSSISFFELKPGEHKTIMVNLRKDKSPMKTLGKFDLKSEIITETGTKKRLQDLSDKGLVLTWIEPDREPTKHIFNDLPLLKKELDSWGGWFVFLYDPSGAGSYFVPGTIHGMPANSVFSPDPNSDILKKISGALSCSATRLPLVIMVNREGEIVYRSEGYRIGIGEQILKNVR